MARTPCWRPAWPLDEDMRQLLHTRSCLWPRGLLPCDPTHSRSTSSTMPWQALSHCPLALGGQFTPRILPPWPSDCLVLQLPLPCAPGDPLAAPPGGQDLRPHPHSSLRLPRPANVLLLPRQPALCTRLCPAQPHRPRLPDLRPLPKDSWALPAVQPAAQPAARLERGHLLSSSS